METLCRIRDIYRAIAEFEVKFMQEFDLSLNEGMLLCTLLNTPKRTSSEIAEALGLSASNTSKVIRSVEDKKLITRLVGKTDKRQMHFALTPGREEPYYGYKKQHSRNSGPIAGDCLERGFPVYSW